MKELVESLLKYTKINPETISIDVFNLILLQNKTQILEWITSDTFKKTYKNNKYAPMFNPDTFNYLNVSPELAWTLNMPLPPYFNFYMIASHATGNNAMWDALKVAGGGAEIISSQSGEAIIQYSYLYQTILQHNGKYKFTYISLNNFVVNDENADKLYALMPYKEAFCLFRDPISLIHSCANIQLGNPNIPRDINLTYNLEEIIQNAVAYGCGYNFNKFPNLDLIPFYVAFRYMHLNTTNFLEKLINLDINTMLFFDASEIVGEGIIEVLKKLDCKFNLMLDYTAIKHNINRLKQKKTQYLSLTNFNIHLNNIDIHKQINCMDNESINHKDSIVITIQNDLHQKECNITKVFFQKDSIDGITISTTNEHAKQLMHNKQLLNIAHAFLHKFVELIIKQQKVEDDKKVDEDSIINYLLENKDTLKYFLKVVEHYKKPLLKMNREDIIEKWKHYAKLLEKAK